MHGKSKRGEDTLHGLMVLVEPLWDSIRHVDELMDCRGYSEIKN